ncbi:ATP-binding cassette domain-containing protein [Pararhizobium sp. YC-54]|uniref:ABC transporter ATP-binding protein n=1 Tax=Pararhizobium sp. YC-54 TaxID=2986920 RepID=UPI0021F6B465|nr:ATP-binding cassette domain-containing protein [Pararhizobium sp. YC-54]MCW0002120.1 ATP-binding cassette domain-containing protein [Pararhizobium sp. YC-54]
MTDPQAPALLCQNVSVTYGPVTALDAVSTAFGTGLIHAVVGQNGAGKTTFARVASGLVRPAAGHVAIGGRVMRGGNVGEARAAGVELVHQSFALPPSFTVAEAMEFGATGTGRYFTRRRLFERWRPHLESLDISVDLGARIRDLPVESQQGIEIARALVTQAKVLILDEPTAVLSPSGIEKLFERVRRLKAQGVTVLLILHKIREVLAIADTVTVLRAGRLVEGPLMTTDVDGARLSRLIIGEASRGLAAADAQALTGAGTVEHVSTVAAVPTAAPVLKLSNITTFVDQEGPALQDVDFHVRPGEIVGVAGVEGNGQRTLVRLIADFAKASRGEVHLAGHDITTQSLAQRRIKGLRIIPFERNTEGLSLTSSLWENWTARALLEKSLLRLVNPAELRSECDTALKAWSVRYAHVGQKAGSLSGGNAQKVILSREIDPHAKLIIAAQPTRGLDIGATAFVWDALRRARDRGCGIILISSDLDELFDICNRLVVMLSGRVAGTFTAPYDIGAVGAAMTGVSR